MRRRAKDIRRGCGVGLGCGLLLTLIVALIVLGIAYFFVWAK